MALVALLIGSIAGAGWWLFIRVPVHEVPDWIGDDMAEVAAAAEAHGWELAELHHDRRDGTTPGEVLAQDPRPGTELAEGEQVALTVSDGPTLTAVPHLAGVPESEALDLLDAAGLELGARSMAYDETVLAGSVIGRRCRRGSRWPTRPDGFPRVPRSTSSSPRACTQGRARWDRRRHALGGRGDVGSGATRRHQHRAVQLRGRTWPRHQLRRRAGRRGGP
ncbi:MAG: PASTA domain-containing protein [Microthrixaceae bacterium]|nr:PASTA domain-containing protein [Microthrixaceae bacterium]